MQFLMQHNYSSSLSRTMICFLSLTLIACGGNYEEQSQQASVHAGPPELPLAIESSARLSGSYNHSLALSTNGNVFSWGANGDGQLGNNSANDSRIPVLVMGLSAVKVVQTGETHSTVLHNNGSVWSWGSNRYGQMGLSTVTSSRLPVQVSGISGVKSIASGQNHVVAVKTDGTVWGWGKTISTATNLPQMMNGFSSVKAVSAGSDFSVALKNDGTVWAWGNNSDGQLGNGSRTYASQPVQVPGLSQVKAIATGFAHTLALMNNGTVKVWGKNVDGQLGIGNFSAHSLIPVTVPGVADIKTISAGAFNSMALNTNGRVYTWGNNNYGQLANGSYISQPNASLIEGLTNVVSISSGHGFGAVIQRDGSVFSFGLNTQGQLGIGLNTQGLPTYRTSAKPVRVGGVNRQGWLNLGTTPLN